MAKRSAVKKRAAITEKKTVPAKAKTVSPSREKSERTKVRGEKAPSVTRKSKNLTAKSKRVATKKTGPPTPRAGEKRGREKREPTQKAETRVIEKAKPKAIPAKEAKRAVPRVSSERVPTAAQPKKEKKEPTKPRRHRIEKPAKTAKPVTRMPAGKGIGVRRRMPSVIVPQMRKTEAETVPERPRAVEPFIPIPAEPLPHEYGENYIILMTVNPYRLFTMWEVKEETLDIFHGTLIVRLYDVTGTDIDAAEAVILEDSPVGERIGKRYFDVSPEREYIAEVGILYDGIFLGIARSSRVATPVGGVLGEEEYVPAILDMGFRTGYTMATNDITATK